MRFLKDVYQGNFPISQRFGENPQVYNRFGMCGHSGVDFATPKGTPLLSAYGDGAGDHVVKIAHYDEVGFGWHVRTHAIVNGEIFELTWAHMEKEPEVQAGDILTVGQILGYSGNTGFKFSTSGGMGYHLHFQVRRIAQDGITVLGWSKWPDDPKGMKGAIDPLPLFDL